MKGKRMIRYLLVLILFPWNLAAQEITLNDFLKLVKENHPIAKAAVLTNSSGIWEVLQSKGAFDPVLNFNGNQKKFKGNDYFTYSQTQLKIPVFYGFDIKTGYERNYGNFLDNESITPNSGLTNIGIQLSLFDVLLTDERRYQYRTAKINALQLKNEGNKILSKLLYDASKEYAEWFLTYSYNLVRINALTLAEERFKNTRSRFLGGDLPSIDTIDAYSELQKRQIELAQSRFELNIKRLKVSIFLWKDSIPYNLSESAIPSQTKAKKIDLSADSTNPEIIKINLKINQLKLDQKIAFRSFFPDINLGYNLLYQSDKLKSPFEDNYAGNNYKMMGGIYFPILMRKSRGKYNLVDNKNKVAILELKDALRTLQNNLDINKKEEIYLNSQLESQLQNIDIFNQLVNAERKRYLIGESTVFLMNARELKFIESKYKLIDFQAKLLKNWSEYYYLAGRFQLQE